MHKIKNPGKFFYSTEYDCSVSESFCSFMKKLKSDKQLFYNMALDLSEKIEPFRNNFDVFISVPKYGEKKSETDYSEMLACMLSSKLNIPYEKNIISKIKYTNKMKVLQAGERFSEIASAFKINTCKYKRICIVDDVYSSGATVGEIIKTFNDSGITDIYVAVLVLQSQNQL